MTLGRICRRAGGVICTKCKSNCRLDNQRRAGKSKAHGLTTVAWQRKRRAALELDGYRCTLRLAGCTSTATTVHLRPELQGNHRRAALRDLTSCCAHCHGVVDGPRASREL